MSGSAHGGPAITEEEHPVGAADPGDGDADLIRRMQDDDLEAFEAFFVRHRGPVFRAAFGLTGDRLLAEEVMQETFTRAHQRRGSLRTDVSPRPWLHRVALNLCYDALGRRRAPVSPLEDAVRETMRDTADGPSETVERDELARIVREGIAALPPKHASVIALYYLQRMSLQEVADTLDVQLGTVKSRVHNALRQLRQVLEEDRRFGGAYVPVDEDSVETRA